MKWVLLGAIMFLAFMAGWKTTPVRLAPDNGCVSAPLRFTPVEDCNGCKDI